MGMQPVGTFVILQLLPQKSFEMFKTAIAPSRYIRSILVFSAKLVR